jgi:hypothetical protein
MRGKNIYVHKFSVKLERNSQILGPGMILSLGIVGFTILKSISIIDFFVMLVLELEINLLPIVLLGQPVFQHCITQHFIVFHVNTVGYDRICFVNPQTKIA